MLSESRSPRLVDVGIGGLFGGEIELGEKVGFWHSDEYSQVEVMDEFKVDEALSQFDSAYGRAPSMRGSQIHSSWGNSERRYLWRLQRSAIALGLQAVDNDTLRASVERCVGVVADDLDDTARVLQLAREGLSHAFAEKGLRHVGLQRPDLHEGIDSGLRLSIGRFSGSVRDSLPGQSEHPHDLADGFDLRFFLGKRFDDYIRRVEVDVLAACRASSWGNDSRNIMLNQSVVFGLHADLVHTHPLVFMAEHEQVYGKDAVAGTVWERWYELELHRAETLEVDAAFLDRARKVWGIDAGDAFFSPVMAGMVGDLKRPWQHAVMVAANRVLG